MALRACDRPACAAHGRRYELSKGSRV